MKITGDEISIRFELERPEERILIAEFGAKFGPYCGSFSNTDRTIQGVEVATKTLFELVKGSNIHA